MNPENPEDLSILNKAEISSHQSMLTNKRIHNILEDAYLSMVDANCKKTVPSIEKYFYVLKAYYYHNVISIIGDEYIPTLSELFRDVDQKLTNIKTEGLTNFKTVKEILNTMDYILMLINYVLQDIKYFFKVSSGKQRGDKNTLEIVKNDFGIFGREIKRIDKNKIFRGVFKADRVA